MLVMSLFSGTSYIILIDKDKKKTKEKDQFFFNMDPSSYNLILNKKGKWEKERVGTRETYEVTAMSFTNVLFHIKDNTCSLIRIKSIKAGLLLNTVINFVWGQRMINWNLA